MKASQLEAGCGADVMTWDDVWCREFPPVWDVMDPGRVRSRTNHRTTDVTPETIVSSLNSMDLRLVFFSTFSSLSNRSIKQRLAEWSVRRGINNCWQIVLVLYFALTPDEIYTKGKSRKEKASLNVSLLEKNLCVVWICLVSVRINESRGLMKLYISTPSLLRCFGLLPWYYKQNHDVAQSLIERECERRSCFRISVQSARIKAAHRTHVRVLVWRPAQRHCLLDQRVLFCFIASGQKKYKEKRCLWQKSQFSCPGPQNEIFCLHSSSLGASPFDRPRTRVALSPTNQNTGINELSIFGPVLAFWGNMCKNV